MQENKRMRLETKSNGTRAESKSNGKVDYSNVLFRYFLYPNCDYNCAKDISGKAILTSEGGHTVEVSEKSYSDSDSDSLSDSRDENHSDRLIGSIDANLISRQPNMKNMHAVCDSISREMQAFGVRLFNHRGHRRGEDIMKVAKSKSSDSGGLLYITSVTVFGGHTGNDIGILLIQNLLKALVGKWTLSALYPALLQHPGPTLFNDSVTRLSRYFARLGYLQVSKKPLGPANYWVLEAHNFSEKILTREAAATIDVYIPPTPAEIPAAEEEFSKYVISTINPLLLRSRNLPLTFAMQAQVRALRSEYDQLRGSILNLQNILGDHDGTVGTEMTVFKAFDESFRDKMAEMDPDSMRSKAKQLFEAAQVGVDINRARTLHFAVVDGCTSTEGVDHETLFMLLGAGANINLQDDSGITPLMLVAGFCGHGEKRPYELLQLLLANGADKNVRDSNGKTALSHLSNSKVDSTDFRRAFGLSAGNNNGYYDLCARLLQP